MRRSSVTGSITMSFDGLALQLGGAAKQDVLEELARSPPGAPVDMSGDPPVENEAGVLENLRVEILRVVHDDGHPGARGSCEAVLPNTSLMAST